MAELVSLEERQKLRDLQFQTVVHGLEKKFHIKNIINGDSFLTTPKAIEDAFQDIKRKYERLLVQSRLPEDERDMESYRDGLEDLAIYAVLNLIWEVRGNKIPSEAISG